MAISGDGKTVFARTGNDATGNNRIVRIDVASGQQAEIVPAMPGPFYSDIVLQTTRGGLSQFGWLGLHLPTGAASQPLPVTLGGLTVRIAGTAVPIAAVEDGGRFWFQVPWDLPGGIRYGGGRRVRGDRSVRRGHIAGARARRFLHDADGSSRIGAFGPEIIVAVHQDFTTLVADTRPRAAEKLCTCMRRIWAR